jgi:hypothetical protein
MLPFIDEVDCMYLPIQHEKGTHYAECSMNENEMKRKEHCVDVDEVGDELRLRWKLRDFPFPLKEKLPQSFFEIQFSTISSSLPWPGDPHNRQAGGKRKFDEEWRRRQCVTYYVAYR